MIKLIITKNISGINLLLVCIDCPDIIGITKEDIMIELKNDKLLISDIDEESFSILKLKGVRLFKIADSIYMI